MTILALINRQFKDRGRPLIHARTEGFENIHFVFI